jgi:hypothetical protein
VNSTITQLAFVAIDEIQNRLQELGAQIVGRGATNDGCAHMT